MFKKIAIILFAYCCLLTADCFAFDFNFRPRAFVSIPSPSGNINAAGNTMYNVGGGGDIGFEIDLSTVWPNPIGLGYTAGVEGGLMINPFKNDNSTNVNFYSFGGSLGLYFFPLSRLFTRIDGAVGVFRSANEVTGNSEPGLFLRGGGELGFRFTPGFTLAANTGWRQYRITDNILNSIWYAGLTTQVTFHTGRGKNEGVSALLDQFGAVYPAFIQLYHTNSLGSVVIRNNENAEIRDVRLSFRAAAFTSSEFPCGSVSIIPRGRTVQLPLLADFSPEILRFTDNGRIVGDLVIRYRFLGQEREVVRAVTVAVNSRNMVSVSNDGSVEAAALAAFISPTSPEVLDFARFVAGIERANRRMGHNQNFNYALWLVESLNQAVIGREQTVVNSVQFPSETLLFRSGTSKDIALLFAACLEAVGIRSAFLQIRDEQLEMNDEIFVAVNLRVNQAAAETLFNGLNRILIINDEVWLPLSMDVLNDGFMACWAAGVAGKDRAFNTGASMEFVTVEEGWAIFPPAPLPELGRSVIRTDNTALTNSVNRALQSYITQEINPVIQRTLTNAQGNAASQNRLGILYARAGRINEAKTAYERAAGLGSVPAMTNRGNLALIERDFAAAERWFRQALQREPQNAAALRGIDRIAGSR
ncbi:MAG: hypothetical protein LBC80_08065 [Treponema sp.]|jgi:tetratricopeptide (TPR) repeat protein|nr:hypothetical protein [Treponema sp.]